MSEYYCENRNTNRVLHNIYVLHLIVSGVANTNTVLQFSLVGLHCQDQQQLVVECVQAETEKDPETEGNIVYAPVLLPLPVPSLFIMHQQPTTSTG